VTAASGRGLTLFVFAIALTSPAVFAQKPGAAAPAAGCAGTSGPIHVEVTFTGICTFADDNPPQKGAAFVPGPMSVYLVDARSGFPAQVPADDPHTIPKHVGYVAFAEADACATSPTVATPRANSIVRYYAFNREELLIDPAAVGAASNGPLTFSVAGDADYDPGSTTDAVCPTAANKTSLYWIPRLSKVLHRPVALKQNFEDAVLAKVHLTIGTLESCLRSEKVWNYRALKNGSPLNEHSQVMAQEVVWRFDARGDSLTLYSRGMNDPAGAPLHAIVTLKPDATRTVRFTVANTIPADIDPDPAGAHTMAFDQHFALYYKLIDGGITTAAKIPVDFDICATPEICSGHTIHSPLMPQTLQPLAAGTGMASAEGLNCGPDHIP